MKPANTSFINDMAPELRLTVRSTLTLVLLTALYALAILYVPQKYRVAAIIALAIPFLLTWKSSPSSWFPFVPFLILFGSSQLELGTFNPTVLAVAMFCLYFFYALDKILWNRPLISMSAPIKIALFAFFVQVISIAVSIHVHGQYFWNAVREGSSVFLFMPLFFIIPDLFRSEDKLRQLGRVITLSLLLAGVVGIIEYLSIAGFARVDISLGYIYRGRVGSFLNNPNVFSGYLELAVPLCIALGMREKSVRWKILSYAAAAAGVLSVLYTFSRGGLACVTLGCSIVMLYRFRKRIWIPVLIGALFIGALVRYADVFERQMSFFANPSDLMTQPTLLHRYTTYTSLFRQFEESPLTGVGWGAKPFFWGRTRLYSFWEIRHEVSTAPIKQFGGLNSLVLTHAVRGGIIGLFALFLVLLSAGIVVFSVYRKASQPWGIGITAGFIAFFTHQTMDNFLQWDQTSCFFWLLMGAGITAVKLGKKAEIEAV